MSSVSPTSSPAHAMAVDESEPYPLPYIASTAGSAAGPTPSSSTGSSTSHWDSQAVGASGPTLIRFLPVAQPGNGPQEALDRMRELARQAERRITHNPADGVVVSSAKYTTSADARGYIPVLEFPLGEQVLMIDSENGLVHWTSIWKLLGNSKADMVRLVEMYPEVGLLLKKVRGGYLKIQGTWLPYDIALNLSRRVAYPIRHDLVALFGADFPASCIVPGQPGFAQVTLAAPGTSTRRGRQKRTLVSLAQDRRPAKSPQSTGAAPLPPAATHYRHPNDRSMMGPVRNNGPMDGSSARYSPYGGYNTLTPQPPAQASLFPSHYQQPPPPPPSQAQLPPRAATMYPEASARYYPPPPPPPPALEQPAAGLHAYRFPPPQAAPHPHTLPSSGLPSPGMPSSFADRRPSLQVATGPAQSSISITQLLNGRTPPETPFSLPLPLVGAKFASPISGDQHQLSVLDGAAVPRRGSQQFKRLLGDRDDSMPPATGASGSQMGFYRRDSLPSPLRSTMSGLSLSDRRGPSPPLGGSHLLSARSATHRLPPVEAERDDDGLSTHSSGVSSPRTMDSSPDPVVIRTHSRDDTDDRSRQGSFTSTLGVYLGPSDGVGRSWPAGKPALDSTAVRFPSILSTTDSGPPSFPTSGYAPAPRAVEARRHSASEQLQAVTSDRSSLVNQASLPSIQRSPLRPW